MVKNIGKKRIETIRNPYLSPILLNLAKGPSTCSTLANHIGKPASTIYVQLKELINENPNYVIKINNNYELNYIQIISSFIKYYNESLQNKRFAEIEIKEYWKNLDSNPYLIEMIKQLFILNINKNKILINIFKDVIDLLKHFEFENPRIHDPFITLDTIWGVYSKDDHHLSDFISLIDHTKVLIREIDENLIIESSIYSLIKYRNPYTWEELTEKIKLDRTYTDKRKEIVENLKKKLDLKFHKNK